MTRLAGSTALEKPYSDLKLASGNEGVRFVLCAGKPTGDRIVSQGPFIADTNEEIQDLYHDYRLGKMQHIATVSKSQWIYL